MFFRNLLFHLETRYTYPHKMTFYDLGSYLEKRDQTRNAETMNRLGAWIEVDLIQLRENFRLIQNHIQNTSNSFVQIMPIVKANAYGHGMIPCVQTLQDEGVFMFGVALLSEAITLQEFW